MTLIKWKDSKGVQQRLRITQSISNKWQEIGALLSISRAQLESWSLKYQQDNIKCCSAVLDYWLVSGCDEYPANWEGLLELMEDMEFKVVAAHLREAIAQRNGTVEGTDL